MLLLTGGDLASQPRDLLDSQELEELNVVEERALRRGLAQTIVAHHLATAADDFIEPPSPSSPSSNHPRKPLLPVEIAKLSPQASILIAQVPSNDLVALTKVQQFP